MLVSVIIPVFNVQNYVGRTIECIQNQSYRDLEIIIVDDGSTDDSGKICDSFASHDQRIKVFHKQNGGVSKARNYGLAKSQGDCFTFIDADDLVGLDYVRDLVHVMKLYDAGVVRPIWEKCGEIFDYGLSYDENGAFLMEKKDFDSMRYCNSIWGLYDKKFISNLFFKEDIHLCEDTLFNFSAFLMAGKMALTNRACYNYIVRNDSVCNQKIGRKQLTICNAYHEMYNLIEDDEKLKDVVEKFEFGTLINLHRKIVINKTYKEYVDEFKSIRKRIIFLKSKWLKEEKMSTQLSEYIFLYCPAIIANMCYKVKGLLPFIFRR
ncbi:putative capsular polysaccharide biosynthesis glycosyltransferase [Fibrobacter succinogenes subsp. succinogenes S85]|uniref:Glycosyl transferase family 2 n=1 Tax=Fibrobacter succinogenes (strain ATCC 19169 / S85) TaxID=59374 RepID=C9RMK7_FIBSS|nr:glycosyltransferase [Fibrobacter succinogenes]ACX76239.1 glycosyl transferase family 2 [Fibrobacter succinogenes subsp. succinogenes S85]ADL26462.1 putative capsular polysaccharide biosynthesis glycosyltransferase [Fibrobacter succinogenes subsp. succinogenes S85]